MVPTKRMSKSSLQGLHLLLIAFLPLLSLLGVFLEGSSVLAANLSGDPQVIIAVDATKQGPVPCKLTLGANIGTPQETKLTLPCPARTIMRSMIVPRSQALKQHESYILLSSSGTSQASQTQNIQQLTSVSSSQAPSARVHPLTTNCGNEGSASLTWDAIDSLGNYIILSSTVTFYILPSPNCTKVVFETSSMNDDLDSPDCSFDPHIEFSCFEWKVDRYAGTEYELPYNNWVTLAENNTYSHSINLENTKGYTYEQVIGSDDFSDWCDIPIN